MVKNVRLGTHFGDERVDLVMRFFFLLTPESVIQSPSYCNNDACLCFPGKNMGCTSNVLLVTLV